jgi:hypothetical protein
MIAHFEDSLKLSTVMKVKVKFSCYRPEQTLGDPEVKAPDFHDY